MSELHARPLQNGFVRVDYQWFGDKPEDRQQHLVKWIDNDEEMEPIMKNRQGALHTWLNTEGRLPIDPALQNLIKFDRRKLKKPRSRGSDPSLFHLNERRLATYGTFAGRTAPKP